MTESEKQTIAWVAMFIDPEYPWGTESLEERVRKGIKELHAILNGERQ